MSAGFERVVLVGFMAAGKSVVGRRLAQRLGWTFVDLDARIEAETGLRVAEIFAQRGESAFRTLEVEATRALVGRPGLVIAPGGGWITQPGLLEMLRPGARVVWLKVSATEAVRRAARSADVRPLLAGPDPVGVAASLLRRREPLYRGADLHVETDGRSTEEIAEEILRGLDAPRGSEP